MRKFTRFSRNYLMYVCFGITVFAALFCPFIQAADLPQVYFAGVAYTTNEGSVTTVYPHISRALSDKGAALDARIRAIVRPVALPETVTFDALGSIKDAAKATALALAIDNETTSIEHIGDTYKLRVEVSAQALFFDFKEKQVLGGFPFTIDLIDAYAAPPTDAQIQEVFQQLLFGASGRRDLVSEFVRVLQTTTLPNAASKRLRVTVSTLAPKALAYMRQVAPEVNPATFAQQTANAFGTYLAANQHISVLPYESNQALGGSMPTSFVEGDSYDLKIPEADYAITLNVAGFKKVKHAQSSVDTQFIYGAFVDVAVIEPLSQKVYFAQRIKQGEPKTVPVTQVSVDDWSATRDTLLSLFDNFTRALSNPDDHWVKNGLVDDKAARTQLKSLAQLVASCH